jgi:20S proteasome alpha/beta subunit
MTLILAAFVTDGIVLASDSRVTSISQVNRFVKLADDAHKVFLTPDNIGVAYTGNFTADTSITQLFKDFSNSGKPTTFKSPDELAKSMLNYYAKIW